MKSQCCNANIEELKGGEGFFSPTTGAYICSACKKYCVRKKDWTGNKKSTFSTLGASSHSEHDRQIDDYYATESRAIDKLFYALGSDLSASVWECACGEGHLSQRMNDLLPHLSIRNSDLINRGFECEIIDFLKYDNPNSFSGEIITNPPYKYAQEFVEKAIETITTGHLVCMFLKLTFLEGQKRKKMFEKYPPKIVYVSSERLKCALNGDFANTGSSAAAYAWFVWEKGYAGETIVKWI